MCIGENARIKGPRKAEQRTPGYPVGYSPFLFTWIYMIEISSPSLVIHTEGVLCPFHINVHVDRREVLRCQLEPQRAGEAGALSPATRIVITLFMIPPIFPKTITWGFDYSTWKRPKSMACSFYK